MFITMLILLAGCSGVQDEAKDVKKESVELAQETTETAEQQLTDMKLESKQLVENMNEKIQEAEQMVDQQIITEGEVAHVTVDSLIALNQESYHDLYGLIQKPNLRDYDKLTDFSAFLMVENGTEVKVLERNIAEVKVKVIETDLTGYIHPSLLSQSS
jgi:hypothetical protein